MYLQDFLFLDDTSTTTTSNPLVINSKAESLKLSVAGNGTLSVKLQGKVDREANDYFDLAVVALASFTTAATITTEGIYEADVKGIKEVRIKHNGSAGDVTVYGVVVA